MEKKDSRNYMRKEKIAVDVQRVILFARQVPLKWNRMKKDSFIQRWMQRNVSAATNVFLFVHLKLIKKQRDITDYGRCGRMCCLEVTEVYAARIKDDTVLLNSSSGGVFTAVSDIFLKRGDAVVCSIYNYESNTLEYRLVLSEKDRDSARGSKYMQSNPGTIYKESFCWLKKNPDKSLLFVGMGCEAAGFRSFFAEKGLGNRICVVDIICHGTPSPMLWREYIGFLESSHGGKAENLKFKDKRNGWNSPVAVVSFAGTEVYLNEYVKIFYNSCALRPSCHKCPYSAVERNSDLTIGDYWHIEDKLPDFYSSKGNSLILIHTEAGRDLFKQMEKVLYYRASTAEDCWQLNLEHPTEVSEKRTEFWEDYLTYGFQYILKKYGSVSFAQRVKSKVKKILGR